jgi:hypothetical protein
MGQKARITASQHFCPLHLNERISSRVRADFVAKVFAGFGEG